MTRTLALSLSCFPSPIGAILLICDQDERLRALDFDDYEARMHRLLRLHYGDGRYDLSMRRTPSLIRRALEAFFAGDTSSIDAIQVTMGGTDFQRRVWKELRSIPAGTTTTYGALARMIGRPSAPRAVGMANGANPIGIVVPCHRVIGADATLTGYGGGLERKRWLLDHERRWNPRVTR